jgi:hypothetical protein
MRFRNENDKEAEPSEGGGRRGCSFMHILHREFSLASYLFAIRMAVAKTPYVVAMFFTSDNVIEMAFLKLFNLMSIRKEKETANITFNFMCNTNSSVRRSILLNYDTLFTVADDTFKCRVVRFSGDLTFFFLRFLATGGTILHICCL